MGDIRAVRAVSVLVVVVFGVSCVLSVLHGHAHGLPSVALGWPILLYLERSTVATAVVLVMVVVVLHLIRGQLPSKLSTAGLEWAEVATLPDRDVLDSLLKVATETQAAMQRLASVLPGAMEQAGEQLQHLDAALSDAQTREKLANAVASLPERQKLALALTHYEGLSTREVAHHLGVSEKAVRGLLVRARAQIARELGDDGPPISPVGVV